MNRFKTLFLVAYLIIVLVGAVVYAQSVSNMVVYTQADLQLPQSLQAVDVKIPKFTGEDRDYLVNITFRLENPSGASIILRTFGFAIAIDNGEPGYMYERERLIQESIGTVGFAIGDAGPRIDPGKSWMEHFLINVRMGTSEIQNLNHTNPQGQYTVKFYDIQVAYSFTGSELMRQFYTYPILKVVDPVG